MSDLKGNQPRPTLEEALQTFKIRIKDLEALSLYGETVVDKFNRVPSPCNEEPRGEIISPPSLPYPEEFLETSYRIAQLINRVGGCFESLNNSIS